VEEVKVVEVKKPEVAGSGFKLQEMKTEDEVKAKEENALK